MAQLGRKTSCQFTISLALSVILIFGLPSQSGAQPLSENTMIDLQERVDQILRSEVSSSQAEVGELFDDLVQVALRSQAAIADTINDADLLLVEAERRRAETLSGSDGTAPVCGPICAEQQRIIDALTEQIVSLQSIENEMEISARRIQERREEVLVLIQAEQFYESIQLIEASFNELRSSLEGIEGDELERLELNVPDILDCPGPGCPLAS